MEQNEKETRKREREANKWNIFDCSVKAKDQIKVIT